MDIRVLRADEIECRVQQVKEKGCVLLLYKDARVDQKILDETFTPMGWKREHKVMGTPVVVNEVDKYGKTKEVVKGQYFSCIVSIWDSEKKEWINKEDTGNESNTDEIKGLYSDSFKRACFNIGIGRELYSAPFTWISLTKEEIKEDTIGGKKRYLLDYKVKFEVKEIEYNDNREISKLVIIDQNGKERFRFIKNARQESSALKIADNKSSNLISEGQVNKLYMLARGKDIDSIKAIISKYGFGKFANVTKEKYNSIYGEIEKLEVAIEA